MVDVHAHKSVMAGITQALVLIVVIDPGKSIIYLPSIPTAAK